jgi:hypothetical protein
MPGRVPATGNLRVARRFPDGVDQGAMRRPRGAAPRRRLPASEAARQESARAPCAGAGSGWLRRSTAESPHFPSGQALVFRQENQPFEGSSSASTSAARALLYTANFREIPWRAVGWSDLRAAARRLPPYPANPGQERGFRHRMARAAAGRRSIEGRLEGRGAPGKGRGCTGWGLACTGLGRAGTRTGRGCTRDGRAGTKRGRGSPRDGRPCPGMGRAGTHQGCGCTRGKGGEIGRFSRSAARVSGFEKGTTPPPCRGASLLSTP